MAFRRSRFCVLVLHGKALQLAEIHTTADPITYTLAEHKDLPGGGTASLALPVDADPTQSNQLWSISALTNTGEVIVLRGGSGLLPPRPRGSDPTRDAHTIRMIIENGEKQGLSQSALQMFRDAYQELADTGALSPETSNKIFVSQHIVQMNLEAIAERHQKELMESFGTLYAAQGADSASAGYRSVYVADMAKANPWIWAEKLRIPFTGTAKNLEEIFTGMVTYAKAETAKVLAKGGGGGGYVGTETAFRDAAPTLDTGGGPVLPNEERRFLTDRLDLSNEMADSAMTAATELTTPVAALHFLESLFEGSGAMPHFAVRTDTVGAQVFLGLYRDLLRLAPVMQKGGNLRTDPNFLNYVRTAKAVELLTAIPYWKILANVNLMTWADPSKPAENWIADRLKLLFDSAHYDHLFTTQDETQSFNHPTVYNVQDATDYGINPAFRRMRFDMKIPEGMSFRDARMYLMENGERTKWINPDNGQEELTPHVSLMTDAKLYIDVPMSQLRSVASSAITNQSRTFAWVQGRIAVWANESDQAGYDDMEEAKGEKLVVNFGVDTILPGDYSTNPDLNQRAIENEILAIVAANSPFKKSDGSWVVGLGSDYHDLEHGHAFHALDISMGSADTDKEVLSVAAGTIDSIDLSYGTVVITHPAQGTIPTWQSKYLHMPLYLTGQFAENGKPIYKFIDSKNNEIPLQIWEGKSTTARAPVGIVSGRGVSGLGDAGKDEEQRAISDKAFPTHIHFEVLLNGDSINLALLAEEGWQIPVSAEYAPKQSLDLDWSTQVDIGNQGGAWVNDAFKLIYFRDPTISDDTKTEYWMAWHEDPAKRERVVYVSVITSEGPKMKWVKDSDRTQAWDPVQRDFFPL